MHVEENERLTKNIMLFQINDSGLQWKDLRFTANVTQKNFSWLEWNFI